jgi:hypothetical protein
MDIGESGVAVTREIMTLSGGTWRKILELLGTGDFLRIEFRPAREADEEFLGQLMNFGHDGRWWICEADYMIADTERTCVSLVTRRIPFRLYDDPVE